MFFGRSLPARAATAVPLVLVLAACGGGNGNSAGNPVPPPASVGPGEWAYALARPMPTGFYDVDVTGGPRALRNDLQGGTLAAEVQFVQSHSMAPSGNDAREMPTPVALRSALLLVLGQGALETADPATSVLTVTASRDGSPLGSLRMAPPALLPGSDNPSQGLHGRDDVGYSRRAWSVALPWDWMRPGLQLAFDFAPAQGPRSAATLPAGRIEFAAPAELVVQNIRLGLMAPPNADTGTLIRNPAVAGTAYFQTVPVARLTIAQYEDMQLDRLIVGTGGGAIHTGADTPRFVEGGTDALREDVAKVQVAQGINLANFGLSDSPIDETQPETFSQRTVVHARVRYADRTVDHGLSGGNGMMMLLNSIGNEFSHEMGHGYGLGHFPGEADNVKNPVHHADSGWGWIATRQHMRGNLAWTAPFDPAGTRKYPGTFANSFNYKADAMSGGEPDSGFSDYTHHTGYSALRIQRYLNTARSGGPRAVPDLAFASGWKGWDAASGSWVDRATQTPALSAPRPVAVGVPVVTLLGGYQTEKPQLNLIYPAFHGNWGVVYDPPAPAASGAACWLEVALAQGDPVRVALQASGATDKPRKFHVNLAESRQPQKASLVCRDARGASTVLAEQVLAAPAHAPTPAVGIGEADGLSAQRDVELAQLDEALRAKPADEGLAPRLQLVLLGWRADVDQLPQPSRAWATRWLALRDRVLSLDAQVLANPSLATASPDPAALGTMLTLAQALGIAGASGSDLPAARPLSFGDDQACLQLDAAAGAAPVLKTVTASACQKTAAQQWWQDASGRIHNQARPDLCLTTTGSLQSPVTAEACHPTFMRGQSFTQHTGGSIESLYQPGRFIENHNGGPVLSGNAESPAKQLSMLAPAAPAVWALLQAKTLLALQLNPAAPAPAN